MNIPFFDLTRQNEILSDELDSAISEVIGSGQFILGDQVKTFESKFADYLGIENCVACANGTDALELVLEALGIGDGDEVLVPAFGWVSPYLAVKRVGAQPVLVDVLHESGNMNPKDLCAKISNQSKAVIPIHLYGNPCEIETIKSLSSEKDLYLIEDCAQAHGAGVSGQKCGTFGDAAIFSFYPTKNLGALGDAGAVVTKSKDLSDKVRSLANYGKVAGKLQGMGRNSRMDELQAAILQVKLKHLTEWNKKRRSTAKRYLEAIDRPESFDSNSIYHQFVLRVDNREAFQATLGEAGIQTDIHYPFSLSQQSGGEQALVSDQMAGQVISLPIFPELSDEEVNHICNSLRALRAGIILEP